MKRLRNKVMAADALFVLIVLTKYIEYYLEPGRSRYWGAGQRPASARMAVHIILQNIVFYT